MCRLLGYSIHPPFMGFVRGQHPKRLLEPFTEASAEASHRGEVDGEVAQRGADDERSSSGSSI